MNIFKWFCYQSELPEFDFFYETVGSLSQLALLAYYGVFAFKLQVYFSANTFQK